MVAEEEVGTTETWPVTAASATTTGDTFAKEGLLRLESRRLEMARDIEDTVAGIIGVA